MPKRPLEDDKKSNNNDDQILSPSPSKIKVRAAKKWSNQAMPSPGAKDLSLEQKLLKMYRKNIFHLNKTFGEWAEEQKDLMSKNANSGKHPIVNKNYIVSMCEKYIYHENDLRTMFQRTPGNLLTFGSGDCGQLALNEEKLTAKTPAIVSHMPEHVSMIACGGLHNAAVTKTGDVYTWGCNDDGSLGIEKVTNEFAPNRVNFGHRELVYWVATGECQTLVLTTEGKVYMFGCYKDKEGKQFRDMHHPDNNEMEEKRDKDMKQKNAPRGKQVTPTHVYLLKKKVLTLDCGAGFNAAKCVDGTAVTWGLGEVGELGRKVPPLKNKDGDYDMTAITNYHMTPLPVAWPGGSPIPVEQVKCGGWHLLVLTEAFEVYTTGLNNYGQLGHGDLKNRDTLEKVEHLASEKIIGFAGGYHHTLCFTQDGELYAFGRGDSGQLGITDSIPEPGYLENTPVRVPLPDNEKVQDVTCGSNHNLLVAKSGNVYSWGYGDMAALGHGKEKDEFRPKKLDVVKGLKKSSRITSATVHLIAGGGQHSAIVCSCDGEKKENQNA